jgi:YHS domain-containing protein
MLVKKLFPITALACLALLATSLEQAGAKGIPPSTATAGHSGSSCECPTCGCMAAATSASAVVANQDSPQANTPKADPYDGQKTCPVSGKNLGTMGKPIAVKVGGKTYYLCCRGCLATFNANQAVYTAKVDKERANK